MSSTSFRSELVAILAGLSLLGGVAVGVAVAPIFATPEPVPVCWMPEDIR